MARKKDEKISERRDFLKLAGLGAVAGSVMTAAGVTQEAKAAEADQGAAGYRETAHVKKAYELSRF